MIKENNRSFSEKNKFSYATIRTVKENIILSKEPLYNPIALVGLDRGLRYRIFWSIFDKDFNREHRGIYLYSTCDKIDINSIKDKRLVIVENIELLNNNEELQTKIKELVMFCIKENIQVILCSNVDIKNLEIEEILKSKILYGLTLYLEK